MMLTLDAPVTAIPRYGKLFAKRLLKLKITTVRDLLLYFPFRYEDLSRVVPIAQVKGGETVTVRGTVIAIQNRRSFRRRFFVTEALVRDGSGTLRVIWFNQAFLTRILSLHCEVWLSGKVVQDSFGLHLMSPVYEKVEKEALHTGRIVPIYSLTPPLTQKQLRVCIKLALPSVALLHDELPKELVKAHKLLPLEKAVEELHFPTTMDALALARRRMAFAELFLLQARIRQTREAREAHHAFIVHFFEKETKAFVQSLSFQLTDDQRKAAWEILADLAKHLPARRLLNGDVGSGKTVVAAIAALNTVLSGRRVLFMVPTEILAEQHAQTLTELLKHTTVRLVLLTASHKLTTKDIANADLLIGTHALLHTKRMIKNVGLVIVDEQHRFGVVQRSALLDKESGATPHLLLMTATPIPRTFAQTIFGDFDISFLRALPKGRKMIVTRMVTNDLRSRAYDFIRKEIERGRQAFVICPLIDPSDTLGVAAATETFQHLNISTFKHLKIGLLHGRMKQKEREQTMRAFAENHINLLVATTIIEVGIDIPNATVMMIEGAERFGLAQLHQLRGRVGRSDRQSYCFLFTDASDPTATKRLIAMVRSDDGFALAEADLKFRGPGEMFGLAQSGYGALRFARWDDLALIKETKEAATRFGARISIDGKPIGSLV